MSKTTKISQRVQEIMHSQGIHPDTSGRWINIADMNKLVESVVKECTNIVNSLEQHEGLGDCETSQYIKDHFDIT